MRNFGDITQLFYGDKNNLIHNKLSDNSKRILLILLSWLEYIIPESTSFGYTVPETAQREQAKRVSRFTAEYSFCQESSAVKFRK